MQHTIVIEPKKAHIVAAMMKNLMASGGREIPNSLRLELTVAVAEETVDVTVLIL
jgi:hypothetical protein